MVATPAAWPTQTLTRHVKRPHPTEVVAVHFRVLEAWRMVPTWCLQAFLLVLLGKAYHYRRVAPY